MRRSLLSGVTVVDGLTTAPGSTSTPAPVGDRVQGVVASTIEILAARTAAGGPALSVEGAPEADRTP